MRSQTYLQMLSRNVALNAYTQPILLSYCERAIGEVRS